MSLHYKIKYGTTEKFSSTSPLEEINVQYNGATVATMNAAGTMLLSIKDKSCAGDIWVGNALLKCGGKVGREDVSVVGEDMSINVITPPTLNTYTYFGQPIDLTGIVVQDNHEINVTSNCTYNPANGVAVNTATATTISYAGANCTQALDNWTAYPLCFTALTAGSTVKLSKINSPSIANTAYSTDGTNWTNYTINTVITLANVGDKVYFRNNIKANFSTSNYLKFVMAGSIAASGNVNSLYNATDFATLTTLTYTYCYFNLFHSCTSLVTPPALPAITLSVNCYRQMFQDCTNLTSAPALPATTLATSCYYAMFRGCTSLAAAPVLPAATLNTHCYNSMLMNCTTIKAPPALGALIVPSYAYQNMCNGCTAIKLSTTQTDNYQIPYRIPAAGTGSVGTSSFANMFSNTGGTWKSTPTKNTTYYLWDYNL